MYKALPTSRSYLGVFGLFYEIEVGFSLSSAIPFFSRITAHGMEMIRFPLKGF